MGRVRDRRAVRRCGPLMSETRIRLTVGETAFTATLLDNDSSRDFIALLPLDLTLTDYAGTEKVSDLPRRLSITDAPAGIDPDVGDITYYAPWGNLAIFYRDFGYSRGLVKLGPRDVDPEFLAGLAGETSATIELMPGAGPCPPTFPPPRPHERRRGC